MTDPVTIGDLTPFADAQAADLLESQRGAASGSLTAGKVVALARKSLQGAEATIRAAPATGASSGAVDLAGVTDGLSVVLSGGAPTYSAAVACVATANVILSGEQTIDGVLTAGSRVLLTAQTAAKDNGVWVTGPGAWTRAADADVGEGHCDDEVSNGQNVKVSGGTTNAGTTWTLTTANPITLGTTALTYTKDGTAKGHNLAFTNPSQTFAITGFAGMVAGGLPITVRFAGVFKLTHSANFYLSNNGADFLTLPGDMAVVFPTGANTCRVKLYPFNGVMTVLDKRTSDGAGQRDIDFGDYDPTNPTAPPALRVSQATSRRRIYVGGLTLQDGLGDTSDIRRISVQADGSPWIGPTPLNFTYSVPLISLNIGTSPSVVSYNQGRHAQDYEFQLETPTATARGGGKAIGCTDRNAAAGKSVTFDAAYFMPTNPSNANVGSGRGLVVLGRSSSEESGQTVGVFMPGSTVSRIWNFSAVWNYGQDIVKGNITIPMSDEAANFSAIAMRTMASPAEGLDVRYNTAADELRLGTVTGDVYTGRWGWQKAGGHMLPVTNLSVNIGSSSRRVNSLYTGGLDASGNVTLGTAGSNTLVMNATSITKPNAPGFQAKMNTANAQANVTGDGTLYQVLFDNERVDRAGEYDPATGVFTAAVTGLYLFSASVELTGVLAAHTDFFIGFIQGTNTRGVNRGDLSPDSVGHVTLSHTHILSLAAGDQVYVRIKVGGSTKVVSIGSPLDGTMFSGCLLG